MLTRDAELAAAVAQRVEQACLFGKDPYAFEKQAMGREVEGQVRGHRVVRLVEAHLPARPVEEREDDRLDLMGHELPQLVFGDEARAYERLSDPPLTPAHLQPVRRGEIGAADAAEADEALAQPVFLEVRGGEHGLSGAEVDSLARLARRDLENARLAHGEDGSDLLAEQVGLKIQGHVL